MIDLKITQTKEFAEVTSIAHLNKEAVEQLGFYKKGDPLPFILILNGINFSEAKNVIINKREVPFFLVSSRRIFALLPEDMPAAILDEIYVLTGSDRYSSSSVLVYELADWSTVRGAKKVVSQFIKLLMTTPGTDSFEPALGAGLQKFPGQIAAYSSELVVKVTTAILRATEHFKASQQHISGIKPWEKLKSVQVISLEHDPDVAPGDFSLWLKIETFAQETIPVKLAMAGEELVKSITSGDFDGPTTSSSIGSAVEGNYLLGAGGSTSTYTSVGGTGGY